MMVLPELRVEKPRTLDEALRILAGEPGARPVAGGTDLLVSMKQGLFGPAVLVDLKGVAGLGRLEVGQGGAVIGASVRLARVRDDPGIGVRYPALALAAGLVAGPAVQNMGTLGGNVCLDTRCWYYNQSLFWRRSRGFCLKKDGSVCHAAPGGKRCFAVFAADTVPALIALGARVRLARWAGGGRSERELPLEDLYVDDGIRRTVLEPGEIVAEVRLPGAAGVLSGFRKHRRRASIDYPLANVAAALRLDGGRMRGVRIVVGALGPAPVLAREAMEALEGEVPSPEVLARAAGLVTRGTRPVANQASTPAHRRRMARVLTRRLLEDLTGHGRKASR